MCDSISVPGVNAVKQERLSNVVLLTGRLQAHIWVEPYLVPESDHR
jgi:hypothetical protein